MYKRQVQSRIVNKLDNLAGCPVTASPHRTLNSCKGVIRCGPLVDCDKQDTLSELKPQGVSDITNITPHQKLIPYASKFCFDEWQHIWECCELSKLHSIYPTVGIVKHSKYISRYDSVLLNRLRIGHSRLTHTYLFGLLCQAWKL